MKLRHMISISSVCLLALTGCEDDSNKVATCNPDTYIVKCSEDGTAREMCVNNVISEVKCGAGQTCNPEKAACESQSSPCQGEGCDQPQPCTGDNCDQPQTCTGDNCDNTKCGSDYIPKCNGKDARYVCEQGHVVSQDCPADTACNDTTHTCDPLSTVECTEADFKNTCATPKSIKKCVDGKIKTVRCANGEVCNGEISAACRKTQDSIGQKCAPETFAETCFGKTQAIGCVEQDDGSYKVEKIDCEKAYKDGYVCDIAFDYLGKDIDVVGCFDQNADACKKVGDYYYDCTSEFFDSYESGDECTSKDFSGCYHQFYSDKYVCTRFSAGDYYLLVEENDCGYQKSCEDKGNKRSDSIQCDVD